MKIFWKKCAVTLIAAVLGSAAFAAEGWGDNYENALKQAKEEKKQVLAIFSGSDWCPPCKYLDANILSKKDFQDEAQKDFVLLFVDFPRRKKLDGAVVKQNAELARKYRINAYPTIKILDAEGKELKSQVGLPKGSKNVKTFLKWLKNASGK